MSTTPAKIGTAGLTDDHHRRWAMGVSSLADIGRELGVSRQTIHEAMRARGWTRTNFAMSHAIPAATELADGSEAVESAEDSSHQQNESRGQEINPVIEPMPERVSILSSEQRVSYYKAAGLATFQAGLMILTEAKGILERERGHHTPISLTRLAETVERAGKIMLPFLLEPPGEEGGPTPLRIEVMTEVEGEALQAELSTAYGEMHEPAHSRPSPSLPKADPSGPEPVPKPLVKGPLPNQANFAGWLERIARDGGKRLIRQIALSLGIDCGFASPTEAIIARIVHLTSGDPTKLESALEIY